MPRPALRDDERDKEQAPGTEVAELFEKLTAEVPTDDAELNDEQRAQRLLAHLLEFHRREEESMWWEFFHRCGFTEEEHVTLGDVLVVAPYNAQVATLRARLPEGARVGTVDKFQGQEAPVVLFSMATSTADEAPRGMEFLYSLHRLNVATSRARCVAAIVANPALLTPGCRTPEQMRLANPFCRFLELASTTSPPEPSERAAR